MGGLAGLKHLGDCCCGDGGGTIPLTCEAWSANIVNPLTVTITIDGVEYVGTCSLAATLPGELDGEFAVQIDGDCWAVGFVHLACTGTPNLVGFSAQFGFANAAPEGSAICPGQGLISSAPTETLPLSFYVEDVTLDACSECGFESGVPIAFAVDE